MREFFYNVFPLSDGRLFVTFGSEAGVIADGVFRALKGLRRPFRVLRGGCAVSPGGSVFWGEYFDNADRGEMHIYRWDPCTDAARVVYTFRRGEIYHIHAIRLDPVDESLLCLTGDRGAECRLLRSRDEFATVEEVGAGDEGWRFVSLVPRPPDWLAATDAEFRQNEIIAIDRTSAARRTLAAVDGPVYYSARVEDVVFFGSTAERCAIQPHPRATLYAVHGSEVTPIVTFEKDVGRSRLAWKLFMPGTIHFPANGGTGQTLWISGVGLIGLDSRVVCVSW